MLDVVFREDRCRARQGNAALNLGWLRRMALALLRQDQSKGSLPTKRLRPALSDDFRRHLLCPAHGPGVYCHAMAHPPRRPWTALELTLARRLRQLREAAGLGVRELARAAGVNAILRPRLH